MTNNITPDPKTETPITVANGGLQTNDYMHNVYTADDYFKESPDLGMIEMRDGQRAVTVSEDFVNGLHSGMEDELDDASNYVMYKCGQSWALRDMKRFNERMRHEFGGGKLDIWQMKMRFVFETWWWPLTVQGWGGWTLDLSFKERDVTFVEIRNSAVAHAMEQVGKPVCHLYAGMFSGVFSYYNRTEQESIEVQCYSMGNDCCKFMIGDNKQVNAAEFWRQEGATAQEIREKL